MHKVILAAVLASALAGPELALGAPGIALEVVPSAGAVHVGESVEVGIAISSLGELAAPSLGTFDLVLEFDPGLFAVTDTVLGPELGDESASEAIGAAVVLASGVDVFELSLLAPPQLNAQQPGSFFLFTVELEAVGAGDGLFDLEVIAVGDEIGDPPALDAVLPAVVSARSVLSVPAVSSWGIALLAAGLLGAGLSFLRLRGREGVER